MHRSPGSPSWRPWALSSLNLALLAVLAVLATGCSDPDSEPQTQPEPTWPKLVESSQSAVNTLANESVKLHVSATDTAQRPLRFIWEATEGYLETPRSSATASDVVWRGPDCLPAGTRVRVTVSITNDVAPAISKVFTLSVVPCSPRPFVAAGPYHSVVARTDGTVWEWGSLTLGLGSDPIAPRKVPDLTDVAAVASGWAHSLALREDGTVWAWGSNFDGQLGDGTTAARSTPARVSGLTEVIAVAAGGYHSLALRKDGTVWAWGENDDGELGDGTTQRRLTPVQVVGLPRATGIAADSDHSLAVLADGTVRAWGDNLFGQLGTGNSGLNAGSSSPVAVSQLTEVVEVAAGAYLSLAVRMDGTVWAWGGTGYAVLGAPEQSSSDVPVQVQVPGMANVTTLAAGRSYVLFLMGDGSVWTWGKNDYGQLGDGTFLPHSPARVPGLAGVTAVAAGGTHVLAALDDGSLRAWGDNRYGQLGTRPGDVNRTSPVQVPGLTGVGTVAAGEAHSLALRTDGTLWAWGGNDLGQVGIGAVFGIRPAPVQVELPGVSAIAAGDNYSLAVLTNGTVWG